MTALTAMTEGAASTGALGANRVAAVAGAGVGAVPVVDVGGWHAAVAPAAGTASRVAPVHHPDPASPSARRAAVACAIDLASRDVGFFQIVGHGIDPRFVQGALDAMDAFFALPIEAKVACLPPGPEVNRGYAPSGTEALSYSLGVDTPPDLLEAFIIGPDHPDLTDPAVRATRDSVFAPNLWPDDLREMRVPLVRYFDAVSRLGHQLLEMCALALGLTPRHFVPYVSHSTETLRLNHYLRRPGDPGPTGGQMRLGAHTDYGILTLLHSDRVPGLELLGADGTWHGVLPEPGAFIVNIGDLLAEWTNDRWRSTVHRVVPPTTEGETAAFGARRRSLAFFVDGNHDALIECLPTCASVGNPPRYAPILAGDHLLAKVLGGRTQDASRAAGAADTLGDRRARVAD